MGGKAMHIDSGANSKPLSLHGGKDRLGKLEGRLANF